MRDEDEDVEPLVEKKLHIERRKYTFWQSLAILLTSAEFVSLAVLTMHMSMMPLLVRQASKPQFVRDSNGTLVRKPKFLATTSVLVSEFFKLIICTVLIASLLDHPRHVLKKIYHTITHNKKETAKVCVPALVYALQNNLYYLALANLDASTFSVTSQLRILTTAVLSVLILKKGLSYAQWGALVLSLIGVVIVQLEKSRSSESAVSKGLSAGSPVVGFAAVFAISWMSAFAGVYFEKVLKESKADVWVQNIRLALLSIPFSAATMFATDGWSIYHDGFFQGWSPLIWLVTFLTALGGILVSLVMKYADNVRKTYCQTVAIAITVLISVYLGDVVPTVLLIIGVLVTISSVLIYMYFPVPVIPREGDRLPKLPEILIEEFGDETVTESEDEESPS